MKVVGLITEYNPFHNGHKYHIEEARRITGADYVIAVMSGNFVQRGTPAVIDKYSRTTMALNNGVDLVLELPVCYATGSAEYFAHGAVSILNSLGIVDYLCFGSEAGNIELLQQATEFMLHTTQSFDETLQIHLKSGLKFPAARQEAFIASLEQLPDDKRKELTKILSEPNNILGIEYLKAIHNLSSPITPVTIRRQAAHYHDTDLSCRSTKDDSTNASNENAVNTGNAVPPVISSATAIRRAITSRVDQFGEAFTNIEASVPADVYQLLIQQYLKTYPITEEDFSQVIKYKLISESQNTLASYLDISSDLADRLKNVRDLDCSMAELTGKIKTKNMTLTRISRSLIHLLLNIYTSDVNEYKSQGYTFYARVLGVKKESTPLLRKIQKSSRIPVITKVSKAEEHMDDIGLRMFLGDIFASHLYNQTVYEKYHTKTDNEYRRGILIL